MVISSDHMPDNLKPIGNLMLIGTHVLIAGATGSGKSTLVNTFLSLCLCYPPECNKFVLIDPKRVELCDYIGIPHTIRYASEPEQIVSALREAVDLMERRYAWMRSQGLKQYPGASVFVVIDEFADLMTTQKKQTLPLVTRLCQLGRASRIFVILCTQRPTVKVLGDTKVNIDTRIALRTLTAQDSRNIIGTGGAEQLPRWGKALYLSPLDLSPVLIDVPKTPDEQTRERVAYWRAQKKPLWQRIFS